MTVEFQKGRGIRHNLWHGGSDPNASGFKTKQQYYDDLSRDSATFNGLRMFAYEAAAEIQAGFLNRTLKKALENNAKRSPTRRKPGVGPKDLKEQVPMYTTFKEHVEEFGSFNNEVIVKME